MTKAEGREKSRRWRAKNPERVKAIRKKCYAKNCEQIRAYARAYYESHKKECQLRSRNYQAAHREELRPYKKNWRLQNPEKCLKYSRKNFETHREARLLQNRKWQIANPDKYKESMSRWNKRDRLRPQRRVSDTLRIRIRMALRGKSKKAFSSEKLLGASIAFVREYLESKFLPGMTWENWGMRGWHIDHIKPCASFDLTQPEQQCQCFHYSNLQPLWAADNLKKKDKR